MWPLLYTLVALFVLVCIFLTLLVLIQKGRGGGLAGAFGGAGGNTAFGSKTGDVLTWATSVVFGIFLLLAVALNLFANARNANTPTATALPARTPARTPVVPGNVPGPGPLNDPVTSDPVLPPSPPPAAPLGKPTTNP